MREVSKMQGVQYLCRGAVSKQVVSLEWSMRGMRQRKNAGESQWYGKQEQVSLTLKVMQSR